MVLIIGGGHWNQPPDPNQTCLVQAAACVPSAQTASLHYILPLRHRSIAVALAAIGADSKIGWVIP
jgi:hypothetical protein